MSFDSERTRYHEAGHAVMAFEQSIGVRGITVVPTDEYNGLTSHYPIGKWFRPDIDPSPRVADRIDRHVRIALAGMSAERIWCNKQDRLPRTWKHSVRLGGQSDLDTAINLALRRTYSVDSYLQWLQAEVDSVLSSPQRWEQVEAIVRALRAKPKLTAQEVRDLSIPGGPLPYPGSRQKGQA